jgi:hypothetical protein
VPRGDHLKDAALWPLSQFAMSVAFVTARKGWMAES